MDLIKGGGKKGKGKFVPPKKPRANEVLEEKPSKAKRIREEAIDDSKVPSKIEVKRHGHILNVVPGHVWRTASFKWNPVPFVTESEQLNSKFIEPDKQDGSLVRFLDNPRVPMIYGISGSPDDSKAKYLAAYLVAAHIKALGSDANPIWNPMYGGFDNPLLTEDRAPPTMLVLTNLTPNSTNFKLEKTRDLIERFPNIPRIIVIAGLDPMSFLATKLYVPVNGLAYLSEGLVKKQIEVI